MPTSHESQLEAPVAAAKVPAAQLVQVLAPVAEYLPAVHLTQPRELVELEDDSAVPALQPLQADEPELA